jgi:hypothetical protein
MQRLRTRNLHPYGKEFWRPKLDGRGIGSLVREVLQSTSEKVVGRSARPRVTRLASIQQAGRTAIRPAFFMRHPGPDAAITPGIAPGIDAGARVVMARVGRLWFRDCMPSSVGASPLGCFLLPDAGIARKAEDQQRRRRRRRAGGGGGGGGGGRPPPPGGGADPRSPGLHMYIPP